MSYLILLIHLFELYFHQMLLKMLILYIYRDKFSCKKVLIIDVLIQGSHSYIHNCQNIIIYQIINTETFINDEYNL